VAQSAREGFIFGVFPFGSLRGFSFVAGFRYYQKKSGCWMEMPRHGVAVSGPGLLDTPWGPRGGAACSNVDIFLGSVQRIGSPFRSEARIVTGHRRAGFYGLGLIRARRYSAALGFRSWIFVFELATCRAKHSGV